MRWHSRPGLVCAGAPNDRRHRLPALVADGRFWSIPIAGGTPHLVLAFDPAANQLGVITFATDGRRIFYTVMSDKSDVRTVNPGTRP